MNISRTHDMELVRGILAHPAIWPHIHDDSVTEPGPIDHPGFFWMLVDEEGPAGVFLLHAHNAVCFEVHTCLLPRIWGPKAKEAADLCLGWMVENTPCQKMITHVPEGNVLALRFARKVGFAHEGVNRKSFLKNGELLDQQVLGLTAQEWQCQQQSR